MEFSHLILDYLLWKWPMLSSCLFPFFYQVLTLVFVYVGGFGKLRGQRTHFSLSSCIESFSSYLFSYMGQHGVASSTISFFVMLAQVPSSSFCLGDFQVVRKRGKHTSKQLWKGVLCLICVDENHTTIARYVRMNVHDYKQVWNGLPLCIQNYMNTSFSTNSSKSLLHSLLFDPSATHGVPS
ncbi:hypothetical protein QQP08_002539, partial [Theobroma cacao]